MLIDLDQEVAGRSFRSDVCVLGAGIAGLVLAHKLATRGVKVHLLEGGGLEPEQRSQTLFDAEIAGDRYTGANDGRSRVFGGTSTQWGGQLLPFTDDVFSPRPGMPSHPWPIGAAEIEPYSSDVLAIMGVNALPFDSGLLPALGHPLVQFGDAVRLRFSKWAPFTRRNLANSLGRQCIAHPNVTVFTHANAMTVDLDESSDRAASVTAKNYAGVSHTFAADHFCVCLGTIESSRLLLASPGPNGIAVGNQHDQIGRYFHDHLSLRAAVFGGPARDRLLRKLGPFYVEGTSHTCKLEASDELRTRMGLPAAMAHFVIDEPPHSGAAAVRNLLKSVQQGKLSEAVQANIVAAMRGIGDIAQLAWQSRIHRRRAVSRRARVYLNIDLEQVPRAEDRIRLSETRDVLGQRKPIVDWHIGRQERDTARRFAEVVHAELERLHLAPLAWMTGVLEDGPAAIPIAMSDTFHPMGGLRMGNHPQSSVVDRDLKLHGVANLHVASCAVFPSGGSSNPTFTLMALTLRLADRLTALLQK
jgi:choline dehydrogenase-like flavoprotein